MAWRMRLGTLIKQANTRVHPHDTSQSEERLHPDVTPPPPAPSLHTFTPMHICMSRLHTNYRRHTLQRVSRALAENERGADAKHWAGAGDELRVQSSSFFARSSDITSFITA